jgi:hypothetical protein
MCAACAMAAVAGASGARTWLQTRRVTWLTPRLLKMVTVALFAVAFAVSSVGLSSSSSSHAQAPPPSRSAS